MDSQDTGKHRPNMVNLVMVSLCNQDILHNTDSQDTSSLCNPNMDSQAMASLNMDNQDISNQDNNNTDNLTILQDERLYKLKKKN